MEKILLILTSDKANIKTIDFSCYIASLTESKLTGVLIEDSTLELASHNHQQSYFKKVKINTDQSVQMDPDQVMRYFSQECRLRGINSDVYSEKGTPIDNVLYESRYADLMIIPPDLLQRNYRESIPSAFVKHILSKSECPVIIAPNSFEDIKDIIFCYDGSEPSLFAIKEFTHLFPQYSTKKLTVLEIRNTTIKEDNASALKLKTWLDAHYHDIHFRTMEGDINDELLAYFLFKEHTFIVMGSYGRNMLSILFKKSASDILIKTVDLPLFIAHK